MCIHTALHIILWSISKLRNYSGNFCVMNVHTCIEAFVSYHVEGYFRLVYIFAVRLKC